MAPELLSYIVWLYRDRGTRRYDGEGVSQLEHALQCAALAEAGGASEDLIAACLLHDLGHLVHEAEEAADRRGGYGRHEFRALRMLRRHFAEAVLTPIRLHVAAKRYLCAVQVGYWDGLSQASRVSLQLQGGIYSSDEAAHFIRQPYAHDAVRLRMWDDRAKVRGRATPDLFYYADLLSRCGREHRHPERVRSPRPHHNCF